MVVIPSINRETTTLDMKLSYKSSTTTSSLNTKVQVLTEGGKVIVGGLEKKSTVTSSSGTGFWDWLFGSETDSVKKSKIVTIIECNPSSLSGGIPPEAKKVIDEVKRELELD